jgi:hypothetical protein
MLSAFDAALMDAEFQSDFQFIGKFRPLLSHGLVLLQMQKTLGDKKRPQIRIIWASRDAYFISVGMQSALTFLVGFPLKMDTTVAHLLST